MRTSKIFPSDDQKLLSSPSADLYENCVQCPRLCAVSRSKGQQGFCKESENLKIAAAELHFGEEPLVTVHGGSGTIFFSGCNLRCVFCQNYQISLLETGKIVSKQEFSDLCIKLQNAGAENINLVTGSHHIPKIAEYLEESVKNGLKIPVCWNSSGYENIETLKLLQDFVTIWLPDLKTLNHELAQKIFCAEDYPEVAKTAIAWMIKNYPLKITTTTKNKITKEKIERGVIVRHLFLPGLFEQTAEVLFWLKENADKNAVISLMTQYTPIRQPQLKKFDENSKKQFDAACNFFENRFTNKEENSDLKDLIEAFDFEYLFYQDAGGKSKRDTDIIPDFDKKQSFESSLAVPIWHWKYEI